MHIRSLAWGYQEFNLPQFQHIADEIVFAEQQPPQRLSPLSIEIGNATQITSKNGWIRA